MPPTCGCRIIEADRSRTVYNWLQHYDPDTLERELGRRGFDLTALVADLTGTRFEANGTDFAAISTLRT